MKERIRIGTRGSLLAVTQSGWVGRRIEQQHPDVEVELVKITTKGDKILDVPLAKVGGKGLFVKELEDALLEGRVDLAVHSMKDVPAELPAGLELAVVPEREDPRDAFVATRYAELAVLPVGARVGTSSLRRKAQLAALRPDLVIEDLRGNLDTRLRKLDDGVYDAIVLAAAGLRRLGLAQRISALFSPEQMLPAIGQGALGIELREADQGLHQRLAFLHHPATAVAVTAERACLLRLEGGCQVPIGAHAEVLGEMLHITGLVASLDGRRLVREELSGPLAEAASMGTALAERILARGGGAILQEVYCA
ncbi:MAG: hydroxymethylbilane synthase [Desulfobulbaceae bacterium A2]|nr:MAG: hydroxymethylbilane synthase [Desulfobulbaceae bacterium A2]